jgi:hypothetical protein
MLARVVPPPGLLELVGPEVALYLSAHIVLLLTLLAARSLAVSSSTLAHAAPSLSRTPHASRAAHFISRSAAE